MSLLVTAASEREEGKVGATCISSYILPMRFSLRNLNPSTQEITKGSLSMLLFWPHLYQVKSKKANLGCAGTYSEGLQVSILEVKSLLQENATLLDTESRRVVACPGREWAEYAEKE